jgi:transposase InsO family protein
MIAIDYFSRFLFARLVQVATNANALAFFEEEVVKIFGGPRAVYPDNGTHFTGSVFPAELKQIGVKHFYAPIRHPSSVGLAERYVQVVLKGLWAALLDDQQFILYWDLFVGQVTWIANTRTTEVHGFTPAELHFGFVPEY